MHHLLSDSRSRKGNKIAALTPEVTTAHTPGSQSSSAAPAATASSNTIAKSSRLLSLDQFRGYSVAAMFVVNFVGHLQVTHHLLKHNNTHFSYADSIMPSFLFACGFAYRMTYLKRLQVYGDAMARGSVVKRSLALILLSLMLTAFNSGFPSWDKMNTASVLRFVAELLKANMWEVLAIIGAVQILTLPIIARSFVTRVAAFLILGGLHVLISWSFNERFVYGLPNWMDGYFGAVGKRAWDGGFFGLLSWAQLLILGTLAHDITLGSRRQPNSWGTTLRLVAAGMMLMIVGYGLSCATRLYDRLPGDPPLTKTNGVAESPVWPDWSRASGRTLERLLAEAPFVPPPPVSERAINYWMMDKRMVTQSFVWFAGGFAMTLFGIFVIVCDRLGCSLPLFRTFGLNPLAAYIIHHLVAVSILAIVPKDSPLAWCLVGLSLFFGITYFFVWHLERQKLYLRL